MSDKKISQLTELTSVDGVNDFIPIVDSSSSETKKVSPSNLPVSTEQQTALDLKANDADLTAHTDNTNNPHSVTAAQVGLGNVNNTSDSSKPVSTAQQTALDLKADVTELNNEIDARKAQSFPYTVDFQSGTEQIRDLSSITSSDGYYYNSNLTSIYVGSSVTSIGGYAFRGCSSLTSITIPDSVTSIGSHAFRDCSSLTSITIPDSVTSIGSYAFFDCSSLTSITIPDSVTSIGNYAFIFCSSLTSINIPDGVTSIGDGAFYSCSSLATINCLATTAPTLGSSVFNNVSATQIHVPAGATGYGSTYGGLTVVADL